MVRFFHTHPNRYRFFILEKKSAAKNTVACERKRKTGKTRRKGTIMVDIGHKSDLLRMDHDGLMELVDGMFDWHSP